MYNTRTLILTDHEIPKKAVLMAGNHRALSGKAVTVISQCSKTMAGIN
jgi:hypothetical protein